MTAQAAEQGHRKYVFLRLPRWTSTPEPGALNTRAALGVIAFIIVLPVYLCTMHTNAEVMSPDPVGVAGSAWSLAHSGTPVLPIDTSAWPSWLIPTHDGLISNRQVGLVAIAALSYLLAPEAGVRDLLPPAVAAAIIAAAAVGVLAVVFSHLVSRRRALWAALIFGLGTTTWAVSSTALWPHGPDQLFLASSMGFAAVGSHIGIGVAIALATLTRPPLAVAAAVEGLWRAVARRHIRPAVVIGAISASGLATVLWYSHMYWGGGLDKQYVDAGSGFVGTFTDIGADAWWFLLANVLMTFVSLTRGVLVGSPFLILLLPGIPAAWRAAPGWVRSSAVAAGVVMAIQLKANRYGGGDMFWSYRYPLESITLLAPLLLLAWQEWTARTARRRAYFAAFVMLAVTIQALGAACYPSLAVGQPPNPWLPGHHLWIAVLILAVGGALTLAAFIRVSRETSARRTRGRTAVPRGRVEAGRPRSAPHNL